MNTFLTSQSNQAEALASIADSLSAISTGITVLVFCAGILTLLHVMDWITGNHS